MVFRKRTAMVKRKTATIAKLQQSVRVIKSQFEKKYIDYPVAFQNDGQSVTMYEILGNITQGDGVTQRTGNRIAVTQIRMSGALQSESNDAYNQHRTTMTWSSSQVFSSGDFLNGGNAYNFHQPQNINKMKPFYDKVSMLNTQVSGYSNTVRIFKVVNYRIPKIVKWISGSATPSENSLYIATVSDSGVTPYPESCFNVRVYFTDA